MPNMIHVIGDYSVQPDPDKQSPSSDSILVYIYMKHIQIDAVYVQYGNLNVEGYKRAIAQALSDSIFALRVQVLLAEQRQIEFWKLLHGENKK